MASNSNNMIMPKSFQEENPIVVQVLMMSIALLVSVSPTEKPKKFNKLNFKWWQQKMLFYLTTLNLARFLIEDSPKLKEDELDI